MTTDLTGDGVVDYLHGGQVEVTISNDFCFDHWEKDRGWFGVYDLDRMSSCVPICIRRLMQPT